MLNMHKKTSHIVNGLFCKPLHTYLMNIHVKHNLPLSLSVQSFGVGFHVVLFLSDILLSVFPVKNTKRHCKIQNMFIINGSWSKGIVEKKKLPNIYVCLLHKIEQATNYFPEKHNLFTLQKLPLSKTKQSLQANELQTVFNKFYNSKPLPILVCGLHIKFHY